MASGGGRRGSRRGKAKKRTKYLSLSRHITKAVDAALESKAKALSLERSPPSALASMEEAVEMAEDGGDGGEQQRRRLEAFALHPEAPSTLFAAAPSLTDILGASSSAGSGGEGSSSCGASPDVSGGTGEEEDLARRALRGRERWVYCRSSSSSSPPSAAAVTTTTTSSSCSSAASTGASARSPLLKLDYEEILAAWAGRGSLYIGGAAAGHAAPELELDPVFVEVGPSTRHVAPAGAAWSAPETAAGRAERVRRYREKRQGRLFSKRIRYEVRRINAVRRPRLKGRFIKEKEEGVAIPDGGDLQNPS